MVPLRKVLTQCFEAMISSPLNCHLKYEAIMYFVLQCLQRRKKQCFKNLTSSPKTSDTCLTCNLFVKIAGMCTWNVIIKFYIECVSHMWYFIYKHIHTGANGVFIYCFSGDIIFNAHYPDLPPDFIFGEDAEFLPDPSALHVSTSLFQNFIPCNETCRIASATGIC